MRYKINKAHEEAYKKLKELQVEGDYGLVPNYDDTQYGILTTNGDKLYFSVGAYLIGILEPFLRRTFKRPSSYSLHGSIRNIPILGKPISVHQGDIAQVNSKNTTITGSLYSLEYTCYGNEFCLQFSDHSEISLQEIVAFTMLEQDKDKKPLPLYVNDLVSLP